MKVDNDFLDKVNAVVDGYVLLFKLRYPAYVSFGGNNTADKIILDLHAIWADVKGNAPFPLPLPKVKPQNDAEKK